MLPEFELATYEVHREDKGFSLLLVPPESLPTVWPYVKLKLEERPELWDLGHAEDTLLAALMQEKMQLWLMIEEREVLLSLLTQIWQYPNGVKSLQIVWGTGERLGEFLEILSAGLEEFAHKHTAAFMEVQGREGFKRVLRRLGYRMLSTTYIKPLSRKGLN